MPINELYFGSMFSFLFDKMNSFFEDKKEFLSEDNQQLLLDKIFDSYYTKKLKFSDRLDWIKEKNKILIEDLSFCIKIVFIHIVKFIFSSIYPYFLNEKNFQKFFKVKSFIHSRKVFSLLLMKLRCLIQKIFFR